MVDSISKLRHYIISKHTFILESKTNGKQQHTIVHDHRGTFEVPTSSLQIVKNSCKAHGSHYDYSLAQSKKLLYHTQRHKLPIVVGSDYGKPLILFPLFSPDAKQNMWILFNNVLQCRTFDKISIVLTNNQIVDLPIQENTLLRQISSSLILEKLITNNWRDNQLYF